jgi:hypothetical protein
MSRSLALVPSNSNVQLVQQSVRDVQEQANSLPYIDTHYTVASHSQVLALINQEMRSMPNPVKKTSFYLSQHQPHPVFEASAFWKEALERIERQKAGEEVEVDGVDLERYTQPEYAAVAAEYERRRTSHLELMMQVAGEKFYKGHVEELDRLNRSMEQDCVEVARKNVNDINRKRKHQQEQVAEQLKRLKSNYFAQCSKNQLVRDAIQKKQSSI